MQEALVGEEWAAALLALGGRGGEVAALQLAPAHAQRGDVAEGRLHGVPQRGRYGVEQLGGRFRQLARGLPVLSVGGVSVLRGSGGRAAAQAHAQQVRHLAQARVVVEALEGRVLHLLAQGLRQ